MAVAPNKPDNTKGTFLRSILLWLKFFFAGVKFKTEAKQLVLLINKIRVDEDFQSSIGAEDQMSSQILELIANAMKCSISRAEYLIESFIKASNLIDVTNGYTFFSEFLNYSTSSPSDNNFHRKNAMLLKWASITLIQIAKDKGITLKEYEADLIISSAYCFEREK